MYVCVYVCSVGLNVAIFEAMKNPSTIQQLCEIQRVFRKALISNLSTLQMFHRGNSSPPYWVANLSITVYPAINNQRFQCFLRGSPPGARTVTHQVLLRVDPEGISYNYV